MSSNSVEHIKFDPHQMGSHEALVEFLERLFLQGGHWRLEFHSKHLSVVDGAFDRIYRTHGLGSAEFTYVLTEGRSNRLLR